MDSARQTGILSGELSNQVVRLKYPVARYVRHEAQCLAQLIIAHCYRDVFLLFEK